MRDPDSGWINASIYRVQVHGTNKVTIQFDHPGPPRRDHRARNTGTRASPVRSPWSTARTRRCSSPASSICRTAQSEYDFAGAIKGAPIEVLNGPAHRPAAAGAGRDHSRRRAAAAEQDHAAGRSVRRVHRLLRRRQAALPGDAGRARSTTATIRSCSARRR